MAIRTYKQFLDDVAIMVQKSARRQQLNERAHLFSIEYPVIRALVYSQRASIEAKVPGVDIDEVVKSAQYILRESINQELSGRKGIEWLDASRDEIIVTGAVNNFQKLQKFISRVKNRIIQDAFKDINKTKSIVKQFDRLSKDEGFQQKRAAILPVIGADINPRSLGGDINLKTDFKEGIFVGLTRLSNEFVNSERAQGFHIGHTFGAGVANLTAFVGVHDDSTTEISDLLDPDIKIKLQELRDEALKIDASIDVDTRLFNKTGFKEGTLSVTIAESAKDNKLKGSGISKLLKQAAKLVEEQKVRLATQYSSSPTILDRYKKGIIELFRTGKVKTSTLRAKKKFKQTKTIKIPVPTYAPKIQGTGRDIRRVPKESESSTNVQAIIDLINRQFHDQIKQNMGKGSAKQKLNYRTGRFAKSGRVLALLPSAEKNTLIANVRYQRYPYAVFEKGGRLYKPLRDPKGIFGRSIRQILAENKIANLRRVKVNTDV